MPTPNMNESVATLWVFGYEFIRIGSAFPAIRAGRGPRPTLVPYPKDGRMDGGIMTPSLAVLDHSTGINAG